ncbi:acetone carboxylase subunit gamma [Natrinema soli]|uniref:Acetone carboxylase subunit gamma n=1 Tax=Natrinema soli TaxID=1930624 RepID=A0ABD5ST63_9EURY
MGFRKYYCPGCGTLLENEVILADLEPIHDRELY